jgi:hypothetical protein
VRDKLTALCREPLVHFLAIGASLFVAWHFFGNWPGSQPERILIAPAQIERLAQQWTKTHLRPPTKEELTGLVEQEIDEEILYREAVALGLDRDDLVIRRRLAMKMEFLVEDLAGEPNPTDSQLRKFLAEHPDKFRVEALTTFAQVFVDLSRRGQGAAAEAKRLLARLNDSADTDWQALGDPLPLQSEYQAASPSDVARVFGRQFPSKLAALPVGRWSGPVESTYGLHLILVRKRTAGRVPAISEVRDAVLNEWRTVQRQELTGKFRQRRRPKYAVTIQWPEWVSR